MARGTRPTAIVLSAAVALAGLTIQSTAPPPAMAATAWSGFVAISWELHSTELTDTQNILAHDTGSYFISITPSSISHGYFLRREVVDGAQEGSLDCPVGLRRDASGSEPIPTDSFVPLPPLLFSPLRLADHLGGQYGIYFRDVSAGSVTITTRPLGNPAICGGILDQRTEPFSLIGEEQQYIPFNLADAEDGWTWLAGLDTATYDEDFGDGRTLATNSRIFWSLTDSADADADGVPDLDDNCPNDFNPSQASCGEVFDADADSVPDLIDVCPDLFNPYQNACEPDTDGDFIEDSSDNCPLVFNPSQQDSDGDGVGDACPQDEGELDADGDGIPDTDDNCPLVSNSGQEDSDGDGVGDACDEGDGGPGEVDCTVSPEADPVYCYAPEVRFHPGETHFPMGIESFITYSSLRWAHNHCPDEEIAAVFEIDPAGLSADAPVPYFNSQWGLCGLDRGRDYYAWELTRPSQRKKASGLATNEGFFLDLLDVKRPGDPVVDGESTATSYVSYRDGAYVDYWFMYGFNPGTGIGRVVDRHEGEWERIMVVLNPDNSASGVYYFAHECPGVLVDWSAVPVTQGTHPVVYAARGSHASYSEIVSIGLAGACPDDKGHQGVGDQTAVGPVTWRTWLHGLRDVAAEPWYGFGGAWGEVGSVPLHGDLTAINTGPLGPPWKDPASTGF